MTDPRLINIINYSYQLPKEKIALYPVPQRDKSKLLIYKKGSIAEDTYQNLVSYLPPQSMLVFNNTKVIHARIIFKNVDGKPIEIFCLEPALDITDRPSNQEIAMATWHCFVGGNSRWKTETLIKEFGPAGCSLRARRVRQTNDTYVIEFSWNDLELNFYEVLASVGTVPLPPYIKREAVLDDALRYQTVFSEFEGSVAAPTAGLHFTPNIFEDLKKNEIDTAYVTLHVGAGTFKPVKVSRLENHEMHGEWLQVNVETLRKLEIGTNDLIAVGTTSARTLETIYWLGVKCLLYPEMDAPTLTQWEVYDAPLSETNYGKTEAIQALIGWMLKQNMDSLYVKTQLLIVPGYQFRMISGLITNFHQPQSTLLLLVAAAVGEKWKDIYQYALNHEFRFLSYGDGSLLYIDRNPT